MRLTKTDYLHWRDCRHNAWWRMNAPDLYHARPPSAFEQTIIDAGDEVEALAGRLFLRGSGLLRDDVAVARADVDGRRAVLLGSAFATDTLATTCDILAWNGAAYDLYVVKASTNGADKAAKDELYVQRRSRASRATA